MAKSAKSTTLLAVVLADNFKAGHKGFTNFALTPFCGNAVLLDYTLESLRHTEVKEVLIPCAVKEEGEAIRSHVKKFWSSGSLPFQTTVIPVPPILVSATAGNHEHSRNVRSVGEVLQHLYHGGRDFGDFVLLQAGAVFNSDLTAALKEHKDRRKKDKHAVMTLVYRKCDPNHPTRTRLNDALFMINRETGRIVHYQKLEPGVCCVQLPTELFEFDDENEVRLDLLDPQIAICSKEIPGLFEDNFDDQTLDDIIKEILINEDVHNNQIHAHIIEDAYAATVIDFHTYAAITKDVISRWSYPVVPDRVGFRFGSRVGLQRKNVYVEKGSKIDRSVTLKQNVIVGANVELGQYALFENSVVGRNCNIGKNVTIRNSVVWDNVKIDDHATIEGCVVMSGARVGKSAHIGARCVVREGATVAPGAHVAEGSVLGEVPSPVGEEKGLRSGPSASSLGSLDASSAPGSHRDAPPVWPPWHPLCLAPQGSDGGDPGDSEDSDEGEVEDLAFDDEEDEDLRNFYGEVQETIKRCFDENMNLDHVVLEINGSKHAYGINIDAVQDSIMKAMLEHALASCQSTLQAKEFWKTLKPILTKLVPVFRKYCSGQVDSEKRYLNSIQTFLEAKPELVGCLPNLLHHMYDKDAMSEAALLDWDASLPSEAKEIKSKIKPFMDWLKADEDEDDSL